MAKYQVYIDQNFLVIQECQNDGTTTVGLPVNEPAKNVSVSAKVDGDTTKYFFTDKTTGRAIAGGIAVDDMFSDTSGTTYADEAAFIAFYRTQLGKSSAGSSAVKTQAEISGTSIDWDAANYHYKTLSASTTFTFANAGNAKEIVVAITNTASNYTVTWPTVDWGSAGAPTQRTGAVADIYTFIQINGTIYGSVRQ